MDGAIPVYFSIQKPQNGFIQAEITPNLPKMFRKRLSCFGNGRPFALVTKCRPLCQDIPIFEHAQTLDIPHHTEKV